MKDNTLMKIIVDKIVYPGRSLGRAEDGIAVFTEGLLPGEHAEINITRAKKSFREGNVASLTVPSPHRIPPRCPSFGRCGGCSFQHTSYAQQCALKETYVRELLAPFDDAIVPLVPSPEEWGYRNKMEFSFFTENGTLSAGLHVRGCFNRYLPVPPCYISDPSLVSVAEQVIAFARESGLPSYDKRAHQGFYRHLVLRKGKKTGEILVNLVTNRSSDISQSFFAPLIARLASQVTSFYWTINSSLSDAVLADELHCIYGEETIREELDVRGKKFSFLISPFSFFQTNTSGTEILYSLTGDALSPRKEDTLLDLYCGTGTIGIVLADSVKEVVGVEQVPSAIENAVTNRDANGITNISFETGIVEKWIKLGQYPAFNVLVVDPPRGGLSSKVIEFIGKALPERIAYVSCNPATLSRDLSLLTSSSPYKVRAITPVDMFPQTYHVECVVALARK